MRRTPALIIGGGPAGAAAAITLAHAGTAHVLLERSRETVDTLCGGFLSWQTLGTLARLGIPADSLNVRRIHQARVFAGARMAVADLPRPALAVSRLRLDRLLLAAAADAGSPVERGVTVSAIAEHVRLADGTELSCDALLLASGKHDVRGLARPASARGNDPALGLRLRLDASPALTRLIGDTIELHLFSHGYAGLVLQEDGSANLCLAVRRSRLRAAGSPAALLAQLALASAPLAERLGHAIDPAAAKIEAIANVPYGWRIKHGLPGLFRLGDQAGVIPSLAGEGIGIALASGMSAALALEAGGASASTTWQASFARRLARPIGVAATIRALAERPVTAGVMTGAIDLVPAVLGLAARLTRIA